MLCEKCGYNLTTSSRCPNCGYDNWNTDYTPVDIVDFSDNPFHGVADPDGFVVDKISAAINDPMVVPLDKVSSELFEYAKVSLDIDRIWLLISVFVGLIHITDPGFFDIRIHIAILCFYALDLVLNLFIKRNKEWILAVYIPFSILFFPVIFISDLLIFLLSRFSAYTNRGIRLIRSRFFVRDFLNFALNRKEE